MDFESVDAVLDFAIKNEEDAADFYSNLAGKMATPTMTKVFMDFAKEELGHKAKLLAVKQGRKLQASSKKVLDLKIGDYLVADEEPEGEIDYQDALILAMKKEKKAFQLYSDLAGSTDDGGLQELFLGLAQEEARHKLRFEIEYDEHILREN